MPQVTVYIREEDFPAWKAIEKKSEFISNALVGQVKPTEPRDTTQHDTIQPLQRACCKLPKPCQHWVYDGVTETWTNTLDGEIKDLEHHLD